MPWRPTEHKGTILVSSGAKDAQVWFSVQDTAGIPRTCRKIFHPFYTTKDTGTGLGLAVKINKIVTDHHGTITVDSVAGSGSTFTVRLPVKALCRVGPPPNEIPSPEHQKRRRERILIAILLVLVVAITTLEVNLVHRGGQPVTGSLLAFGLLNINTFLLLLFTFLIFRHLSKLFLERRRKVFGSRLRTRLVLTFITLTLMPTLFLFFMAWQLMSSRVDFSWDRQVELSLDQALAVSRNVPQQLKGKLLASGREVSLELMKRENWGGKIGVPWKLSSNNAWRFLPTGVSVLDSRGTVVAESAAPQESPLPAIAWQEVQSAAEAQDKIIRRPLPQENF